VFGLTQKKKHPMSKPGDPAFKVILVGNSMAGKSALTLRLADNIYYADHTPTLGVDFKYSIFGPQETGLKTNVRLNVWDSAGQDTFMTVTQQFIRGADAAFLCYDITDRKSFTDSINKWRDKVLQENGKHGGGAMLVLVGCKADLEAHRAVARSEADQWASQHGIPFFETSAKQNDNVRPTFAYLAKQLAERKAAVPAEAPQDPAGTRKVRPVDSASASTGGRSCPC
jgi:small GTP-binding protein